MTELKQNDLQERVNRFDDQSSIANQNFEHDNPQNKDLIPRTEFLNDISSLVQNATFQDDNNIFSRFKIDQNKHICYYHKLMLNLYCQTCEEPICEQCKIEGPHNNKLHVVDDLLDLSYKRASIIQLYLKNQTSQKRSKLLNQMKNIMNANSEILHHSEVISRDTKSEFEGVLKRLVDSEGHMINILQRESTSIQRLISQIDDVYTTFNHVLQSQNPISLLLLTKHLNYKADVLLVTQFKQSIDQSAIQLPREITNQRINVNNLKGQNKIQQFRCQAITSIAKEIQIEKSKKHALVIQNHIAGINNWIRITKQIAHDTQKMYMICYFCSEIMSEKNINKNCNMNLGIDDVSDNYTKKEPSIKKKGTRRHYFYKPHKRLSLIQYGQYIRLREQDYGQDLYYKLQQYIELDLMELRTKCYLKKLNLIQQLEQLDKLQEGYIPVISFQYLLNEQLECDLKQINRLTNFFQENDLDVNYALFIQAYQDSDFFNQDKIRRTQEEKDSTWVKQQKQAVRDQFVKKNPFLQENYFKLFLTEEEIHNQKNLSNTIKPSFKQNYNLQTNNHNSTLKPLGNQIDSMPLTQRIQNRASQNQNQNNPSQQPNSIQNRANQNQNNAQLNLQSDLNQQQKISKYFPNKQDNLEYQFKSNDMIRKTQSDATLFNRYPTFQTENQ